MGSADEIRIVLEAKAQALVERKSRDLHAMIHSDFVYVNASGQAFDKAGYIETFCSSGKVVFVQQRFADIMVKLIDDFAVATLSISDEIKIEERILSGRYQSLCVFSRSSGRWLWVAGQTMTVGTL